MFFSSRLGEFLTAEFLLGRDEGSSVQTSSFRAIL
jgi:hypothetical protein